MTDTAGRRVPGGRRLKELLHGIPAGVRRDYAVSVAVLWLTLATGLLLFHLVARRDSVDGFAYYQIARSAVAVGQPLAMVGLGTGLQRYLPRAGTSAPRLARQAFVVQLGLSALVTLAGVVLAGTISRSFGVAGGTSAVVAITVLLAGNCLCTSAVASLRGTGQVTDANVGSVLGVVAVPLLAFVLARRIEVFLLLQGAGLAAVAGWGIAATRVPAAAEPGGAQAALGSLLRYSLRRTPGDIALPALFTLPTFAVAGMLPGRPEAGYVGFTTSAITLICSVFGMLTPVLLPRLSGHFHDPTDYNASLHRGLLALPPVAAGLAGLFTAAILLLAKPLVLGFLGPEFGGAVPILRLGLLAAVPLAMYYAVRPSLDAIHDAPVTTGLLLGSLALELVLTFAFRLTLSPPFAAVAALCAAALVLGVSSYLALVRALARRAAA